MGVGGRPGRVGSHRLPLRHLELGWRPRQWNEMAMGEKRVFLKKRLTFIYFSHHIMPWENHYVTVKRLFLKETQPFFSVAAEWLRKSATLEIRHFHSSVDAGHPAITGVCVGAWGVGGSLSERWVSGFQLTLQKWWSLAHLLQPPLWLLVQTLKLPVLPTLNTAHLFPRTHLCTAHIRH